jgi:hypothetical protein
MVPLSLLEYCKVLEVYKQLIYCLIALFHGTVSLHCLMALSHVLSH